MHAHTGLAEGLVGLDCNIAVTNVQALANGGNIAGRRLSAGKSREGDGEDRREVHIEVLLKSMMFCCYCCCA
jgi:hypothetical protein